VLHVAQVAYVVVGIFHRVFGQIQSIFLFHYFSLYQCFSFLFNLFHEGAAAFVLLGLEVFPLSLHLSVEFKLGVALGVLKS
jgi:hypothetical protein